LADAYILKNLSAAVTTTFGCMTERNVQIFLHFHTTTRNQFWEHTWT